jgi:hypothetical protein
MKTTTLLSLGLILSLSGCGPVDEVFSGDELLQDSRPALAENGTVVAAEAHRIHVGLGEESKVVSLPAELDIYQEPSGVRRLVRVRSDGDIVFVARKQDTSCTDWGPVRGGVYRTDQSGATVRELFSSCSRTIPRQVAMSPNGTVAFANIVSPDGGAIWRGPVDGTMSVLRSRSNEFHNTFAQALDVNDQGQVLAVVEYRDAFANASLRAAFLFETPEQDTVDTLTLMEKSGGRLGDDDFALNHTGGFIWSTNGVTVRDGSEYEPGIYRVTPTSFNAPKDLTKLVGLEDGYCAFGAVDLNDHGEFVFEATRPDGSGGCDIEMDGIFRGPDPVFNAVILRGSSGLGQHAQFDKIVLGELNNQGELSFLTTSSQSGVPKTKVWRSDAVRRAREAAAQ